MEIPTPGKTVYIDMGPWFNIKMSSYQYRKSHCGNKTISRPSYCHNGISYTGKMTWLYSIRALIAGTQRCYTVLTHWGRVTLICVNKLTIIGSGNGLSPGSIWSHYLNQCWNIVNWTIGNKLQWNFNRNENIFIQENAFENIVWKMAAILSRPQWVNPCGAESILGNKNI